MVARIFKTIKGKLIVVSVALILIPLIVLGIVSYHESYENLNELGKANLQNGVELTLELIHNLNQEVENGHLSLQEAQEKVKIAVLGERNEEGIRPINENLNFGEMGYIYILDQQGNQIAHPYTEGLNVWDAEDVHGRKFTQEIIDVGNSGGGFIYYDWPLPDDKEKIEPKVTYSKTDPHWGWVVNAGTYMKDFDQPAKNILQAIVISIITSFVIGFIVIWFIVNRITVPIQLVTDRMNQLANRDLSMEPITIKTKDETKSLADSTNHFQSGLRNMLHHISDASHLIAASSEQLAQSANEVMNGAEQVSATMQELASAAETEADSISGLAATISVFNEKIVRANEEGETVNEHSKQVLQLTDEGSRMMENSVQQMDNIDRVMKDAVFKIQQLDVQANEISKLVVVIKDVAEQTNLLALNAAIEAARAGEHGKGFAVVADEVRKLAEQVSNSVTDVTEIVNDIQRESKMVMESLENGYKEVAQGTNQMETTRQTFETIKTSTTEVIHHMTEITDNLSELVENSQEINHSIETIASLSEEYAAGIEETSASAEQSMSSMQEIAGSTEELAKSAENLNSMVQRFKL